MSLVLVCYGFKTFAVGRWYVGRRLIAETCWTSLRTLGIRVMLLLHREDDLCVDMLGSTITLETTGSFTSCELLHGGRKDKQINGGLEAWSGLRRDPGITGWEKGVFEQKSQYGPGTSDPLPRYIFISWLTEHMPTPHMEFCLHLIYGSQLLQPLQLPAAHHMELLEEKSEVEWKGRSSRGKG